MLPIQVKKGIINSLIAGSLFTLLIFFMIMVLSAQLFLDIILPYTESADGMFNIFIIFMLIESIAIVISVVVPFFMGKAIKQYMIFASAILGILSMLLFFYVISFLSVFFYYSEIFEGLEGFDAIRYSPVIIVYFGIYVIGDITIIWWFSIIIYYCFYALFLYLFARKLTRKRIAVVYKW